MLNPDLKYVSLTDTFGERKVFPLISVQQNNPYYFYIKTLLDFYDLNFQPENTLKNVRNRIFLTKILTNPAKSRTKRTPFLIKNARIFTRIYAQYEFIYSSLYLVKRKIKLPLSAKTALLSL